MPGPNATDWLQSFARRHELRGKKGWGNVAFADGHVHPLRAALSATSPREGMVSQTALSISVPILTLLPASVAALDLPDALKAVVPCAVIPAIISVAEEML